MHQYSKSCWIKVFNCVCVCAMEKKVMKFHSIEEGLEPIVFQATWLCSNLAQLCVALTESICQNDGKNKMRRQNKYGGNHMASIAIIVALF